MREEADIIARVLGAAAAAGAPSGDASVLLGPGDDAAFLRPPPGQDLVWTVDDQVEGVHFRPSWGWAQVGRKAVGACLSDLAACGARPWGLLLALHLPADLSDPDLEALAGGIAAKLAACACPLLGGNTTRSAGGLALSLSALGTVPTGRGLRRDAARPGDLLFVSGPLGLARVGLRWLEAGGEPADPALAPALSRLLDPVPRLDLVPALVAPAAPRAAAMDLSDGLARDLPRLLRASGLAARVDLAALPGPSSPLAERVGATPGELAWLGGEDYELLIAGPPELAAAVPGLHIIGSLEAGPAGEVRLEQAPPGLADAPGYDPFR